MLGSASLLGLDFDGVDVAPRPWTTGLTNADPAAAFTTTRCVERRRQEERDVPAPGTRAHTDWQATLHPVPWRRVSRVQHVPIRLGRAEMSFVAHRADRT